MRETLASRLGFILLSAGCAIGIGNVWRFPYVTGQSGGGTFVLIYLFFLAVLGLPVLIMEFAAGRAARRSIALLHRELKPSAPLWSIHGLAGFVGNLILMMFYTTVCGWMLIYFVKFLTGSICGLSGEAVGAAFGGVVGDWQVQTGAMLITSTLGAVVCAIGLRNGLERVTKWMMLALLALIVVLAVNSCFLPGAGEGLKFYLLPDLARMRQVGVGQVIVNAMNQSFFTLSLGIGAMAIFGSYIDRRRSLPGEAVNVVVLDTFVAVCAGLIIMPACFAYHVEPGQGPSLIFVTLPNVFNNMAGGRLWGALFFLFMSFAALSTVFAVYETLIACLSDWLECRSSQTSCSPRKIRLIACALVGVGVPLLSMPCIFGFNHWSSFTPFGAGSCVLDLEDFLVSDILLPLGALTFVLFCTTRYGWGWKNFVAEANEGQGLHFPSCLRFYCGWVLPVVILSIFVIGLMRRFG